jgi:hypothetical protein
MMDPPFGSDDHFWDNSPGLWAWRSKAITMRGTLSGANGAIEKGVHPPAKRLGTKMALLRGKQQRRGGVDTTSNHNPYAYPCTARPAVEHRVGTNISHEAELCSRQKSTALIEAVRSTILSRITGISFSFVEGKMSTWASEHRWRNVVRVSYNHETVHG